MEYLIPSHIALGLTVWTLTIFVIVGGVVLVFVAAKVLTLSEPKPGEKDQHSVTNVLHHVFRDIGISLLVAGSVTIVYGSTLDFQRVSDAISMMIGENVPQSVWDTTKSQIFSRSVLRGNLRAKWIIQWDDSLPPDQALIKVRIEYDIYGLKPQPFPYPIGQELENIHLQNADGTLPRFDNVIIDGRPLSVDDLKKSVVDGKLNLPPVTLKPWKKTDEKSELTENTGVHVVFERSEILNIPGTYTVVVSELTKGAELEIDCPRNVQHQLKEWFDRGTQGFQPVGSTFSYQYKLDGIILPGQTVSVQFWRPDAPTFTPSPTPNLIRPIR